jgi:hypothetical protein
MLDCLGMVLEQVQRNLNPMWHWLEALSFILCILIHAPRKSHERSEECGLAAGCFVTISSPPIYNLDASCFLLTHPRFILYI